ncbi:Crp/Fnr family transcriptional regulator [Baekduia soli]|uniref:Crp/Fnr family transcriptional regulator n=1 Tax=Baekduia soli TaxID=496014 RepID=A0A5B8U588_9ACTN|nr:Crp/Fnr family transcriptional regulator [Baekduia soli]QEC48286.1 Crp/Fnr family transcriptional regulator [Baekduia soli]
MEFSGLDLIRVFEYDPDLLDGLDEPVAAHLRTRLTTRRAWADAGPWTLEMDPDEIPGHLGMLVIDGLLVRTVRLAERESSEVVGPGELLRPWDSEDTMGSVECVSEWRVLQPTTFASLDRRFAELVARWPTIIAQLLSRSARRCRTLVHQATIAHVRHAETRVLLALWHLADRWGRVTADGVVVPVPLTHQLLAQLTCLQRPTVSGALSQLKAAGVVSRRGDGGWLLHGDPPSLAGPEEGTVLTAV